MSLKTQRMWAWMGVATVLAMVLVPLAGFSLHLSRTAQELEQTNAKLNTLVSRRSVLESDLAALSTDTGAAATLVPGVSAAVASATVQERVRLITEAAGGSLDSARVRPAERVGAFEKVSMTVRLTSDTEGLARVLREVEYGRPGITVEKLAVRANRNLRRMSNGDPGAGTDLIATIDLGAWRRP